MGVMGVTVERNAALAKLVATSVLPMIAVGMCQERGVDVFPADAYLGESPFQPARSQAQVDEDAEAFVPQETGVAAAAAGQNAELHCIIRPWGGAR